MTAERMRILLLRIIFHGGEKGNFIASDAIHRYRIASDESVGELIRRRATSVAHVHNDG